jgi:cation:H+ antiporter
MEFVFYLFLGFLLLWKGGDLLVAGADAFARSHGVPPTLAGVLILGFGTSLPELAITTLAAIDGNAGIAVGNVVGSNIANVGLVLGVAAIIAVVHVNRFLVRIEMPVGVAASVLALVLMLDGKVDLTDGLVLLAAFVGYAAFAVRTAKKRDLAPGDPPPKRPWFDLGKATLALAAVIGGAHLFKEGAILAAEALNVSQTAIGLTLVALGTSLPELSTAIAAARARKQDLVVGNIIGSNIFNLLMVLGVAGVCTPQVVEDRVPRIDVPVMLALAVFPLLVALVRRRRVERWAGWLLLVVYVAFVLIAPAF